MKKPDTWMPLYIGDYLGDTMHLTTQQHGAYMLLLMHYWRAGPLPDDDQALSGIARLDRATWKRAVASAIRPFFQAANGLLHQKRMDAERAGAQAIIEKRRKAANTRWADEKGEAASANQHQPATGQDASAYAHAYANGHANGHANGMQNALPRACALPSPSQKKKAAKPGSKRSRAQTTMPLPELPPPASPTLNDPPEAWLHLGDGRETDSEGRTHATLAGCVLDTTARVCCEAAGHNGYRKGQNWKPLLELLRDGYDLHEQILPTLRRVASRPGFQQPRAGLAYFAKIVRDEREAA